MTWRDHGRAADAAAASRDWAAARSHLLAMDTLLGGHPSIVVALARNAMRAGDTAEALGQLSRVARMGVRARLADSAFNALRALPAFQAAERAIAASDSTIGRAEVIATIPDSGAIAEDLAFDAARSRFIVSDVRRHRLRSVGLDGTVRDFGAALPAGWGVLGVGVDASRGVLWATTVTIAQAEGYTAADSGRAAILRLDLRTGAVQKRYDLPSPTRVAPGDIAIAENHDVFFGDGMTGAILAIRAADTLETLLPAGRVRSTQQPAIAPDGRSLYIAEYARGIARVDRATGAVTWLGRAPDVLLTGIDGLLMSGRDLMAVQNNVNPNRIVRLVLDPAGSTVVRSEIVLRDASLLPEPTHVAMANGALYAIGNAGWSKYGDDGAPAAGVAMAAPRILRILSSRP